MSDNMLTLPADTNEGLLEVELEQEFPVVIPIDEIQVANQNNEMPCSTKDNTIGIADVPVATVEQQNVAGNAHSTEPMPIILNVREFLDYMQENDKHAVEKESPTTAFFDAFYASLHESELNYFQNASKSETRTAATDTSNSQAESNITVMEVINDAANDVDSKAIAFNENICEPLKDNELSDSQALGKLNNVIEVDTHGMDTSDCQRKNDFNITETNGDHVNDGSKAITFFEALCSSIENCEVSDTEAIDKPDNVEVGTAGVDMPGNQRKTDVTIMKSNNDHNDERDSNAITFFEALCASLQESELSDSPSVDKPNNVVEAAKDGADTPSSQSETDVIIIETNKTSATTVAMETAWCTTLNNNKSAENLLVVAIASLDAFRLHSIDMPEQPFPRFETQFEDMRFGDLEHISEQNINEMLPVKESQSTKKQF